MQHARVLLIGLLCSLATVALTHAQEVIVEPDVTRLKNLYELFLKNPESSYAQTRIGEERQRLHRLIEGELQQTFAPPPDGGEPSNALIEQQKLMNTIEERIRERKVDLDLLSEEEQKYLSPSAGTGAEAYSLTSSHAELLAQKALLEERLSTLDALHSIQQERQEKLQRERQLQQIALMTRIGKFAALLSLIWFLEKLIRTFFLSRIRDINRRYTVTKFFSTSIYGVVVLWLLTVLFSEHPGILASLAIVGAGLAISLQDVVKDIVGWLVIMQYSLFTKGDRISVGTTTGEVIDIGVLRTALLEVGTPGQYAVERTGRTLFMPNSLILTQPLVNAHTTSDFTKTELCFDITFESNWKKAEQILQEILQEETREFAEKEQLQHVRRTRMFYVPFESGTPKVFKTIAADGIKFTLKFSTPIGEWRPVISHITEKVLERFAQAGDIELAYRTSRVYASTIEPSQEKKKKSSHPIPYA